MITHGGLVISMVFRETKAKSTNIKTNKRSRKSTMKNKV